MLALDPRGESAVWTAIEAHLPPRPPDTHPLGGHRPRISDRDCFKGILIRLVTGCSWEVAAQLSTASETTLRNRRTEWLAAGLFDKLLEEALAAYDRIIGLDLSAVAVDGSTHKAPSGGEGTGPNPHRPGQDRLEAVSSHRPLGHPAGLDHRRRQPQQTAPCSSPPSRPSPRGVCSPISRPCTSTAATTAKQQ